MPAELLRFSKLVTAGHMTRGEALQKVSEHQELDAEPANLEWFLHELGVTREQFEELVRDPLRHMQFNQEPGRAWRMCRAVKRFLFNPVGSLRRARAVRGSVARSAAR